MTEVEVIGVLVFAAMIVAAIGLTAVGTVVLLFLFTRDGRTPRLRRRLALAEAIGVEVTSQVGPGALIGTRGGLQIILKWQWPTDGLTRTQVMVDSGNADLPVSHGDRPVNVGDPDFDSDVRVTGDPAVVLAALDAHTRFALCTHASLKGSLALEVRHSRVFTHLSGHVTKPSPVGVVVDAAQALAQSLADVDQLPHRLADNAANDPVAEVRLRNLSVLVRRFDGPVARHAAQQALDSDEPRARVYGAWMLRRANVLAEVLTEAEDPDVRRQAVRAVSRVPIDERLPVLRLALADPHPDVVRAAVLGAAHRAGDLREELTSLVDDPRVASDRTLAAALIGALRVAEAEDALVRMLDVVDRLLVGAVAKALGDFASVRAVEPLLGSRDTAPRAARAAANAAVVTIQRRVDGGELGALALSEGEAGALSLSADRLAKEPIPGPTRAPPPQAVPE